MIRLRALLVVGSLGLAASAASAGEIRDNSFLIEEAYNQERGVVQHIGTWTRNESGSWVATFTQEWPLTGMRHQVSFTLPFGNDGAGSVSLGVVALNYRWQAIGGGEDEALAVAPRVSVLLPLYGDGTGLDGSGSGLQLNLPLSLMLGPRWVVHANAGMTWQDWSSRTIELDGGLASLTPTSIGRANLGGSLIWSVLDRADLMLETSWERLDTYDHGRRVGREHAAVVSPGVRVAFDPSATMQIVPGFAVPIGIGPSRGDRSVLLYLSVEHAF